MDNPGAAVNNGSVATYRCSRCSRCPGATTIKATTRSASTAIQGLLRRDHVIPDPSAHLVVGLREREVICRVERIEEDLGDGCGIICCRWPLLDHLRAAGQAARILVRGPDAISIDPPETAASVRMSVMPRPP